MYLTSTNEFSTNIEVHNQARGSVLYLKAKGHNPENAMNSTTHSYPDVYYVITADNLQVPIVSDVISFRTYNNSQETGSDINNSRKYSDNANRDRNYTGTLWPTDGDWFYIQEGQDGKSYEANIYAFVGLEHLSHYGIANLGKSSVFSTEDLGAANALKICQALGNCPLTLTLTISITGLTQKHIPALKSSPRGR